MNSRQFSFGALRACTPTTMYAGLKEALEENGTLAQVRVRPPVFVLIFLPGLLRDVFLAVLV